LAEALFFACRTVRISGRTVLKTEQKNWKYMGNGKKTGIGCEKMKK